MIILLGSECGDGDVDRVTGTGGEDWSLSCIPGGDRSWSESSEGGDDELAISGIISKSCPVGSKHVCPYLEVTGHHVPHVVRLSVSSEDDHFQ